MNIFISEKKMAAILLPAALLFNSCGSSGKLAQVVDTIEAGEEYNAMHFVVAKDASSITLKEDNININKPGEYTVVYELASEKLKYSDEKITVKVVDTTPPVFGSVKVSTDLNGNFDITKCLKATDNADGDVSANIKLIKGKVDVTAAGNYSVTAEVTDSSKNSVQKEITVSVIDREKITRAEKYYKIAVDRLRSKLTYPDSLTVKNAAVCDNCGEYTALVKLSCSLKDASGSDAENDFYIGIKGFSASDSQFSQQMQESNALLWSESDSIVVETK